jgi:hypothetical protein
MKVPRRDMRILRNLTFSKRLVAFDKAENQAISAWCVDNSRHARRRELHETRRRAAAKLLTRDETWRFAANIAKLPQGAAAEATGARKQEIGAA